MVNLPILNLARFQKITTDTIQHQATTIRKSTIRMQDVATF